MCVGLLIHFHAGFLKKNTSMGQEAAAGALRGNCSEQCEAQRGLGVPVEGVGQVGS